MTDRNEEKTRKIVEGVEEAEERLKELKTISDNQLRDKGQS